MDWNIRKNRKYIALMIVFCALVPHLVLRLLRTEFHSRALSPAEAESMANFFVCQWLPFWLVFVPYLRVQKRDTFSLIPVVLELLIVLSFLGSFAPDSVRAIAMTVPLMLVIELSGFLKKGLFSGSRILAGLATNRGMLRAFFFWSVAFLCVALISCEASTWYIPVVSPFLTLPLPAVLLADVFYRKKEQRLNVWGGIAMLAMVPFSLYLVTVGPMARFMEYHLMGLGTGFAVLAALLLLYSLVQ